MSAPIFNRYSDLKKIALWDSADGVFDAYISCDLPTGALQGVTVSGIRVANQGQLTQLVCSYAADVNFVHRTRATRQPDPNADCAAWRPCHRKSVRKCKLACRVTG